MNYLSTTAIVVVAYLAAFVQSLPGGLRNWLGVQVDLLSSLMVYCGLSTSLGITGLVAVTGGLCFDVLSANPLGISILPLFVVGFIVQRTRDLVLREQLNARIVLGAIGSALTPLLSVLLLWGSGYRPLIGWGSLWQWLILAGAGGVLTPLCFLFFERLHLALAYSRQSETTFRPDREIKRGRD